MFRCSPGTRGRRSDARDRRPTYTAIVEADVRLVKNHGEVTLSEFLNACIADEGERMAVLESSNGNNVAVEASGALEASCRVTTSDSHQQLVARGNLTGAGLAEGGLSRDAAGSCVNHEDGGTNVLVLFG